MITMIGVGVERPGKGIYSVTQKTDFVNGFTAVTNIVFAYCKISRFQFCQSSLITQAATPVTLASLPK